jgi:hypothetical protein
MFFFLKISKKHHGSGIVKTPTIMMIKVMSLPLSIVQTKLKGSRVRTGQDIGPESCPGETDGRLFARLITTEEFHPGEGVTEITGDLLPLRNAP